jgi:hypothetical protein
LNFAEAVEEAIASLAIIAASPMGPLPSPHRKRDAIIEHLARNPGLQAGEVSESARRALLFGI